MMDEDLIARLRAVKVRTPEEVMALYRKVPRLVPIDAGWQLSQGDWAEKYETQGDVGMASLPEIYQLFKDIEEDFHEEQQESKEKIRESMISSNLVILSSTQIEYFHDSLYQQTSGVITHNYNLEESERTKIMIEHMPRYDFDLHTDLLEENDQELLRALFDTPDSCREIIKTLEFIFGENQAAGRLLIRRPEGFGYNSVICVGALYLDPNSSGLIVSAAELTSLRGVALGVRYDE